MCNSLHNSTTSTEGAHGLGKPIIQRRCPRQLLDINQRAHSVLTSNFPSSLSLPTVLPPPHPMCCSPQTTWTLSRPINGHKPTTWKFPSSLFLPTSKFPSLLFCPLALPYMRLRHCQNQSVDINQCMLTVFLAWFYSTARKMSSWCLCEGGNIKGELCD